MCGVWNRRIREAVQSSKQEPTPTRSCSQRRLERGAQRLDYLRDRLLVERRHEMHAAHAGDLRVLLHEVDTDRASLGRRIAGLLEPLDDPVGNDRSEQVALDPAS